MGCAVVLLNFRPSIFAPLVASPVNCLGVEEQVEDAAEVNSCETPSTASTSQQLRLDNPLMKRMTRTDKRYHTAGVIEEMKVNRGDSHNSTIQL